MGNHLVAVLLVTAIGSPQAGPAQWFYASAQLEGACFEASMLKSRPARTEMEPHPFFLHVAERRQTYGIFEDALHHNAEELYKATSRDAETFEAALLIPEVRLKLERALRQKLSDQMLRHLALQAKLEAIYWYKYMQGLERGRISEAPIE